MTPHLHVVALAIGLVCAAANSWAERITLNDTGMTQCVSKQKEWTSDCAKSGQDAADGRDVRSDDPDDGNAGFSFRKVCRSGQMAGEGSCPADPVLGSGPDHWGCTYDNITELTWEMKTDDGGVHDDARRYTNKGPGSQDVPSDAAYLVKATNEEALCGSKAWRLPDPIELQSIVNYGDGAPNREGACLDPTFFPTARRAYYWTRTESVWDTKSAWYVEGCGRIAATKRFDDYLAARLVHRKAVDLSRRALAVQKERFIPSTDGLEVTDTMTGLIWRRCAEGSEWSRDTQTCVGAATQFQWREALDYVRANRQGGWRLPNIKELFSIVDFERQDPALDPFAFPNAPDWTFLSSTPIDSGALPHFKVVYFSRGTVEQQDANKFYDWPLRLVRRGRK